MTPQLQAVDIALPGRLQPTRLTVGGGELVAVVGPNGGGKTSLLRALADVEGDAGSIYVAAEDLRTAAPARRAKMLSFLPASREVAWPIRARDVIALSATQIGQRQIDELVDLLELGPIADRSIDALSTGERTRVLLARAMAAEPGLLLLDEPLSNLDPYWVLRIVEILRHYVAGGRSALHQLDQADSFDRILLVDHGRLVADGAPETLMGSRQFADSFNVERHDGRWRIRPRADPQSLP